MLVRFSKASIYFLGTLIMMFLLLCLPSLFTYDGKVSFQPFLYVFKIEDTIKLLMEAKEITFQMKEKTYPLFPTILEPYTYSLLLLAGAFGIALLVAMFFGYCYMLLSMPFRKVMRAVLFCFEAIPDIMIIVGLQAALIWYFKQTGDMPMRVLTFGEKKAYLLPIICLCILPTIQMFRMLIIYLEEEQVKPYVDVVRGKGFSRSYITILHLYRNVLIHLFYHAKTIFLFMLSNLFVLEYIFNINGIMKFLIDHGPSNTVIAFTVVTLVFVPFYALFVVGSFVTNKLTGGNET
ncbi:ABC transporter permease subunit [Ectobacillus antri]|jgi:peptide/nickel transport system permease protein|uniref:ABC transporter permease subunit n=1 Tax=Ectobacillus antri TaxID=2486280 RepID=A0ABT6H5S1_9BACI|nr:ABC transporter permease subunit [Ectobacillus antri]MDG4656967.1 ABC transporter permease subunit [Ectobacillus antri]MDG5754069.1 ABC transporter permease subunit [Ectobacillus antri]